MVELYCGPILLNDDDVNLWALLIKADSCRVYCQGKLDHAITDNLLPFSSSNPAMMRCQGRFVVVRSNSAQAPSRSSVASKAGWQLGSWNARQFWILMDVYTKLPKVEFAYETALGRWIWVVRVILCWPCQHRVAMSGGWMCCYFKYLMVSVDARYLSVC